ncbi:MAG: DUF305 domain-containing protein [Gemmatimonadales bacterium]
MHRLIALSMLAVCAGCGSTAATGGAEPARPAPGAGATTAPTGDVAEQAAIVDSIRRTYTQADVDFMAGMIHHHAQALVMARMAPSHGASPAMLTLTRRIINAQRDEILLMQRWLRDRGEEVPQVDEAGHVTMSHAHGGMEMMPGMLSAEQLAALDAARGEEFDRLFLQFMIQHHQGALTMVDELVGTEGGAREQAVFKLASDIGADQASEITRMQTMLRDILFADGDESP